MTRIRDLHEEWMKDPEYRAEYERLAPEFDLAGALIGARVQAGLTQEEIAQRMNTTQSAIARLESGKNPSIRMLRRFAEATGTHLKITFERDCTAMPDESSLSKPPVEAQELASTPEDMSLAQ